MLNYTIYFRFFIQGSRCARTWPGSRLSNGIYESKRYAVCLVFRCRDSRGSELSQCEVPAAETTPPIHHTNTHTHTHTHTHSLFHHDFI